MSRRLVEGNLLFNFGPRWTRLLRWDRHAAYEAGMMRSHEGKAVDFIGLLDEKTPYLIEVKDFRSHRRSAGKEPLEREFELKVRCTVAALLGARCREEHLDCIVAFDALIKVRNPHLVLWIEEPRPERTPGHVAAKHRNARAGTLTQDIKRNMLWLDARTSVTSMTDGYQSVLPDVTVTSLEPDRLEKVEQIIERLQKDKLPSKLEWDIRDCLNPAILDDIWKHAVTVNDARRRLRSPHS